MKNILTIILILKLHLNLMGCGVFNMDECDDSSSGYHQDGGRMYRCTAKGMFDPKKKRYLDYNCNKEGFSTRIDSKSNLSGYRCSNSLGDIYVENLNSDSGGLYCSEEITEKWIIVEILSYPSPIYYYCSSPDSYRIKSISNEIGRLGLNLGTAYDDGFYKYCGTSQTVEVKEDRSSVQCG